MSCMICDIEYVCMECEQLQKGLKMNSDLLDIYCESEFGHKDWAITWDKSNLVITFYAEPREGYFSEEEEDEDVSS